MSGAVADLKKQRHEIYENYFESTYPPLPLPMIWRLVYQEAVRGNHILWDRADLEDIEKHVLSNDFKLEHGDKIVATRFMADFFQTVDYNNLQAMLKTLTLKQKSLVFLLYRRAISVWQTWLKVNLH